MHSYVLSRSSSPWSCEPYQLKHSSCSVLVATIEYSIELSLLTVWSACFFFPLSDHIIVLTHHYLLLSTEPHSVLATDLSFNYWLGIASPLEKSSLNLISAQQNNFVYGR